VSEGRLRRAILYAILFGTMLMFGLIESVRGVSFPLIRNEFDLPFERQGLMVSLFSLAFVLSNIIAGIFLGRFGIKSSAFAGYSSICLGIAFVFFVPGFSLVAFSLFVVFFGFGFLDVGMNALASRLFVTKAAMQMNLLHAFYGIGSIIGPLVAGLVVTVGGHGWRSAYVLMLPVVLLLFAMAVFARFPRDDTATAEPECDTNANASHKTFFDALRSPMVWLLALALGIGVAVESNTSNWGPLYFYDLYEIDPATDGARFLSVFFLLFTVSRLVCGPIVERAGYVRSLIAATALTLVVLVVGFSLGARGIFVLPALGFLVALFWPTLMAVSIVSFGRDAPVFGGALIAISGIVNTASQYLVGLTNRIFGPAWGYRSTIVYTVALVVLLSFVYRELRRRKVKNL